MGKDAWGVTAHCCNTAEPAPSQPSVANYYELADLTGQLSNSHSPSPIPQLLMLHFD